MDNITQHKRKVGSWTEEQKLKGQLSRARQTKAVADLTIEQWRETLEYFRNACAYCGGKYQVIEHYLSPREGGTTVSNCVPACSMCNNLKDSQDGQRMQYYRNKRVVDFLTSRGAVIKIHVHELKSKRMYSDVMEIFCDCGYSIGIYTDEAGAKDYIEDNNGVLGIATLVK